MHNHQRESLSLNEYWCAAASLSLGKRWWIEAGASSHLFAPQAGLPRTSCCRGRCCTHKWPVLHRGITFSWSPDCLSSSLSHFSHPPISWLQLLIRRGPFTVTRPPNHWAQWHLEPTPNSKPHRNHTAPRQHLKKESHGYNSDKMTLLPESWLSPSPSPPSRRWTH